MHNKKTFISQAGSLGAMYNDPHCCLSFQMKIKLLFFSLAHLFKAQPVSILVPQDHFLSHKVHTLYKTAETFNILMHVTVYW